MNIMELDPDGTWIGRVERAGIGPCIVTFRDGELLDVTSRDGPTVRDILEQEDPCGYVKNTAGDPVGSDASLPEGVSWLAPCDFQAIKACGVTFVGSMIERVIEERAMGDPAKASHIRDRILAQVGSSLKNIAPGSEVAAKAKQALISEGLWSQYLEVGIGPDAEVFSKAQVLSSVGHEAEIGIHPVSFWNNPEPEVVLAVTSQGRIVGASLGNDVNLRDVEGRSALLLSKAKDNNASCAIGPMIRLFDDTFSLDDVRRLIIKLTVSGEDGFELNAESSMREISRSPEELVRQTIGRHHQYPDGLMLFLGTLFAPTQDREEQGQGFTHKIGDIVNISCPELGSLHNIVNYSTNCREWTFGPSALARNLAARKLI